MLHRILVHLLKQKFGKMELITLTKRANKSAMPEVEIVDLRQELANGNHSIISDRLREEIQNNLNNKKQTILFLNMVTQAVRQSQ